MIRKKKYNRKQNVNTKSNLSTNRINEEINNPKVQLVGDNVENASMSLREAIDMAYQMNLDLVEVSSNEEEHVSICRIIDYKKYLFDKKKKQKEAQSKNKTIETKEIRLTPTTDEHDFLFKAKHAQHFLEDGNKVKIMLQFKGRTIMYKDRGIDMINKLVETLKDYGTVEEAISEDRRRMHTILIPNAKQGKKTNKA